MIPKHPDPVLTEEHDEGERQTKNSCQEVGQRQRHDESIGHRSKLSVFDDDDDDSRVPEAGEEEDGKEYQGLSCHHDALQDRVTLRSAQH